MSLALARKYRPNRFDDLIGQDAVSQTLSLALDSNRLSHAYLFSGLRGSGKTSTARIFAKALICDKGATSKPCEVCSNCIMANESRHIDIVEMDGASNRKIDNIRELIEHTKYKPAVARYKIFIIDEVHMLTKEAFNALLKTLEEPPDFVKFILATTDPLKLPATILSRTQHFRFRKVSQSDLERHLEHILNFEKVGYEKNAVAMIARVGAGSVRDALTLLDQAIIYSKNFIDVTTVTNMLGIIEPSILKNLIDSILAKDEKAILEFISKANDFEVEMVIDELSLYLKDVLLSNSVDIEPLMIDKFFRILVDAKQLLNIGSNGEFILALTLFKMMDSFQLDSVERPIIKKRVDVVKPKVTSVVVPKREIVEKPKEEEPLKKVDSGVAKFTKLIERLYDRNYELGQCFERNIKYVSFNNNNLIWESMANGEDKQFLRYQWGRIRMFAQEIFGFEIDIKNIPKKLPSKIDNNHSVKTPSITPKNDNNNMEKNKSILDEPMVAKALKLFAPKKVSVQRRQN